MEIHSPNIIGPIQAAGSVGTLNQVLTSQATGQVTWQSIATLTPQYLFTDKAAQVIVLGPEDITWNAPAADAFIGVTQVSTVLFRLPANRLYRLVANITPTAAAIAYSISWVDTANALIGSLNQPANGQGNNDHIHALAIFRPLVQTDVKLRLTSSVAVNLGVVCSVEITAED